MKEHEIHRKMLAEKRAQEKNKDEKYKEESRERLKKILRKKMQTVMIGALSAVEERFGFLWGHGTNETLTENQAYVLDLFKELRSQILDIGNAQIRNAETEIDTYTVEWNRYQYNFKLNQGYQEFSGTKGNDNECERSED